MSLIRSLTSVLGVRHVRSTAILKPAVHNKHTSNFPLCSCAALNVEKLGRANTSIRHGKYGSIRDLFTTNAVLKKSSKSASAIVEGDDPEDDPEEFEVLGKGDKIIEVKLTSDRLDAVLKAGLGMSRNKIEKAFYSDRVRLNGARPKKKSQTVDEGDEVDVIRRYNVKNPDYLDVSRLEIISLGPWDNADEQDADDEYRIPAKLKRSKNLTIENYKPPFKGNLNDD